VLRRVVSELAGSATLDIPNPSSVWLSSFQAVCDGGLTAWQADTGSEGDSHREACQ
jgi:hypothetical protein